ncbi:TetR/AcrR family transcriptional regulator [Agromyces seonyuensis]|uniref:TetR family transcriptional regulator n=1 Tax=Agromyces seonyuensis TaxID=2662446 RepID=A0A6I4NVR7_9MICO|nr:TetR/AcrR family transcriptional regulator [Agromyces seonyuensis]MWB98488.1 TetR family transcriptional regulator [Agromyces seonyuensis]
MKTDLRERTHAMLRAELTDAAFELIVEHGYDAMTADELARALGISRASFFRYLGSKDDVIVSVMLGEDRQFGDALRAVEPPRVASQWELLRIALAPAISLAESAPERQRARLRLIQSAPELGARLRRARVPQIDDLAAALVERGTDEFAAAMLASAAVAVLDQCWSQWQRNERASLADILDRAFAELDAASSPARASS